MPDQVRATLDEVLPPHSPSRPLLKLLAVLAGSAVLAVFVSLAVLALAAQDRRDDSARWERHTLQVIIATQRCFRPCRMPRPASAATC